MSKNDTLTWRCPKCGSTDHDCHYMSNDTMRVSCNRCLYVGRIAPLDSTKPETTVDGLDRRGKVGPYFTPYLDRGGTYSFTKEYRDCIVHGVAVNGMEAITEIEYHKERG